jgi:acetyl esterase/lipase
MKVNVIDLKELYPVKGGTLKCIAMDTPWSEGHENWKRPAVIVVPGGAYRGVSPREGEPVAMEFLAKGFQAFVLKYLCRPDGISYPEQLIELASAVDYVKKHADEYSVNADEIFVVGFSAGGHLTANLAVEYQSVSKKAGVELDCKPTAVGLSYPVISGLEYAHRGSFDNILGERKDDEEARRELSLELRVDEKTVPAFIWTTATDTVVPPQNSIMFAQSLAEKGIPFEMHVYPKGGHGSSLANPIVGWGAPTPITAWVNDSIRWMKSIKIEENNG